MKNYEGANGINAMTLSQWVQENPNPKINKSEVDINKMLDILLEEQSNVVKIEMLDGEVIGEKWKQTALKAAKEHIQAMKNKLVKIYKIHMGEF